MASFSDGSNRTWEVIIDGLGTVKKIRKKAGITICDVYDEDVQKALVSDFEKMADVVWCLIESQAAEQKVTREQFENQLHGQVLEDMREALRAEVSDFLPSRERDTFQMYELMGTMDSLPKNIREKMMDGLMEPMQDQLKTSMENAGESPDGSALTPAD